MSRRIITNPTTAAPLVAGGLVIVGILWAANQRPRKKSAPAPAPTPEPKKEDPPKNGGTTPPAEPCRADLTKLGYSASGSYSEAVKAFQKNYNSFINWYNRRVPADRRKQSLVVDGKCGPLTVERIAAALQIQANGGYIVVDSLETMDRLMGTWQQIAAAATAWDSAFGGGSFVDNEPCRAQLAALGYNITEAGYEGTVRRFKDDYNAFLAWYNGRVPPDRKANMFALDGSCPPAVQEAMRTAQGIQDRGSYRVANATQTIDTITGNWRQVAAAAQAWRLAYGG